MCKTEAKVRSDIGPMSNFSSLWKHIKMNRAKTTTESWKLAERLDTDR